MSDELRAVLTEALKAHRIERCSVSSATESSQWGSCSACEFETDSVPFKGVNWDVLCGEITATHHAEIIASLPGVAVIQLPDEAEIRARHISFGRGADCECCPPWIKDEDIDIEYSVSEAREFAAALLAAAAVVATGEEHHG
ncbi:hypothetical protein N857_gp082 [Mycobacterium phage Wanda]|uniref:hypothetical protein n=1 Tax=Mycobacterium phage Wanda TaxID=1340713 RepID=UPI0003881480|nr:hypothetical protein N857_gp082 [Mycobacterium phage Wanda]AGT11786.1 hypothetical protein PBI_WANDA_82 [Mycobacterium phage Wanda]ATN89793.1 hypothetical protein SEA_KLEIN_78 [Mycobacterium phage Klein]